MKINQPTPPLKKSLTIDLKSIGISITKATANATIGSWDSTADNIVELLNGLGVKTRPEEIAWVFLARSYLRAVEKVAKQIYIQELDSFTKKQLTLLVQEALSESKQTLDASFFANPIQSNISNQVRRNFNEWVRNQGYSKDNADILESQLQQEISTALHEEWASNPLEYRIIQQSIETPFTSASKTEFEWLRYAAHLRQQVNARVFFDSFSLVDIYIPPRGYFALLERNSTRQLIDQEEPTIKTRRRVISIKEHLSNWLTHPNKGDFIKLVSGGPGTGKSSFSKVLAEHATNNLKIKTLLIPIHHFDHSSDLIDSIGKFLIAQGILSHNPITSKQEPEKLLVIFDGLDELSLQGRAGERAAFEFLREIIRKSEQLNQINASVYFCITGREVTIQTNETLFRKEGQIIHILPFNLSKQELKQHNYVDPEKILAVDQRNLWWTKYGELTGQSFTEMPSQFSQGKLDEVTAQPLLNYLVALAYRHGKLKLDKDTNLNLIYEDLLREIYERGWSSGTHAANQGLSSGEFNRILEEVALCAWHSDGRKTSTADIQRTCAKSNLSGILEKFQSGIESDPQTKVTQLLTAFYFRQNGINTSGESTFEFTHKSFGEYLAARRILRELALTSRKTSEHEQDSDEGWGIKEACIRLINLLKSTEIDEYLFEFLADEVKLLEDRPTLIQNTIIKIVNHIIRHGLPIEGINPRPDYFEEQKIARSVERNLIIILNACARHTKKTSVINWPTRTSFGELLSRTVGQRQFVKDFFLQCLSYMDLSECILCNRDLWSSNFEHSTLASCNLVGADCRYSNFKHANLRGSYLSYANCDDANFESCSFGPSNAEPELDEDGTPLPLEHEFDGTRIDSTKFKKADLRGMRFSSIDLTSADFRQAQVDRTHFFRCSVTVSQKANLEARGAVFSFCTEYPDPAPEK